MTPGNSSKIPITQLNIGVMLRAFDGKGGVGVSCQNLMDHLLEIDRKNRYVVGMSTNPAESFFQRLDR